MSPAEAAERIGCSPQHVRWLIRNKRLKARRVPFRGNQHGYLLSIEEKEVDRFKAVPKTMGAPRKRKKRKIWKPPSV